MIDFVRKMTDWILDREEKMAQKCAVPLEEIDAQIARVTAKKKEFEERCKVDRDELERILTKLKWIRAETLKCQESNEDGNSIATDGE
ncbi:hypothetical protein [Nitratifractor sp.]